MKKSLILLIALFLVFAFAACDILDLPLSVPTEDEITDSSTSSESSKETEQSETELKTETKTEEETYYGGSHKECAFCGLCDGGGRWFIGKVMENHLIMPLGTNCFEKNAAGDVGIDVWYKKVDGEERTLTAGEYVCVMYGGYIMESFPVQIGADKVSKVDGDLYGESVPVDPSICNHKWILSPSVDYKFTCSYCNCVHICTDPDDWVRDGNLNESTLIYRCKICGSEHLTTDPDSIKPDDEIDSPLGSMLKFEIIDEKLRCQTVPSASRIVYSHISDMSKETVYDNRYDIINVIFQSMDGKTAILDTYECVFLHYVSMFDSENPSSDLYEFKICDCGAVTIIKNNKLLCSIEISDEELQMILDSLNFF